MSDCLSDVEVAERLKIAPKKVRKLVRDGRLAGVRIGHDYLIPPNAIAQFFEREAKCPSTPAHGSQPNPDAPASTSSGGTRTQDGSGDASLVLSMAADAKRRLRHKKPSDDSSLNEPVASVTDLARFRQADTT